MLGSIDDGRDGRKLEFVGGAKEYGKESFVG